MNERIGTIEVLTKEEHAQRHGWSGNLCPLVGTAALRASETRDALQAALGECGDEPVDKLAVVLILKMIGLAAELEARAKELREALR